MYGEEWLEKHAGEAADRWDHPEPGSPEFTIFVVVSVFLVLVAGLMSGLTLGLLSLDRMDLELIMRSGNERDARHAAAILPMIEKPHQLLVTLVLCNAGSMEALPMVVDRLTSPLVSLLLSVSVVLLFGEIVPQAICTRYGLAVGYYTCYPVYALMFVTFPIAWPIAKVLDLALGSETKTILRRAELRALFDVYEELPDGEGGEAPEAGGEFSQGEVNAIRGALDLAHKPAYESMTPLDQVYMLNATDRLDVAKITEIIHSGFSRIPVYRNNRNEVIGILMVRELALVDPAAGTPVKDIPLRTPPRFFSDAPQHDLLDLFQTGRSHLALLVERPNPTARASIEHASQEVSVDTPLLHALHGADEEADGSMHRNKTLPATKKDRDDLRHGRVVGLLTLEDVLESLLSEEILDETDSYVDNERKEKVTPNFLQALLPPHLRGFVSTASFARPGSNASSRAPSMRRMPSGGRANHQSGLAPAAPSTPILAPLPSHGDGPHPVASTPDLAHFHPPQQRIRDSTHSAFGVSDLPAGSASPALGRAASNLRRSGDTFDRLNAASTGLQKALKLIASNSMTRKAAMEAVLSPVASERRPTLDRDVESPRPNGPTTSVSARH
ncbi:unnamed protein product [Pedinophyceae sp. YPF-701]|nr:unnamed protein product [Pedinophyceae sp. YPF-701]